MSFSTEKYSPGVALRGLAEAMAMALTFLLPLKLGLIVGVPELAVPLPDDLLMMTFTTWPPLLFSVLAGILLVLAALAPPFNQPRTGTVWGAAAAATWLGLALVSPLGMVNATVADFADSQVAYLFGVAAYALAVWRLLERNPRLADGMLTAITFGTIFSAFTGLHQQMVGFEATREFAREMAERSGVELAGGLQSRLEQSQVFGHFGICNSLAAHLILTIPLCLWWFARVGAGRVRGQWATLAAAARRLATGQSESATAIFLTPGGALAPALLVYLMFQSLIFPFMPAALAATAVFWLVLARRWTPATASRLFLAPVGTAFVVAILYLTASRAAVFAFGLALGAVAAATLATAGMSRRKMTLAVVVAVAITLAGVAAVNMGRSLASMNVRFDYYQAAARLFLEHPLAGSGWGEFFHGYTRLKFFPSDEAPHSPHNLLLSFASQTGIAGLLTALLALCLPIAVLGARLRRIPIGKLLDSPAPAILLGWLAWTLHSLADLNLQIPATLATAAAMAIIGCGGYWREHGGEPDEEADEAADQACGEPDEEADEAAGKAADQASGEPAAESAPTPRQPRALALFGSPVLALLVGLAALLGGWRWLASEAALARLQTYCDPRGKTPEEFRGQSLDTARRLLKDCVEIRPQSPFPYLTAADFALANGAGFEALNLTGKALELSPRRSSLHYRMARMTMAAGRPDEAKIHLANAIKLFPRHPGYRQTAHEWGLPPPD